MKEKNTKSRDIRMKMNRGPECLIQKREAHALVTAFGRILFKEQLILFRRDGNTWKLIETCDLHRFMDGTDPKADRNVRRILEKSMRAAVLAVVVCAGEKDRDYYGFWLGGGTWHVFPNEKLQEISGFFV